MVEPSTARHEAHRGDSGFAEANAGLQPAAVLKPDRDNDTSVIRGPAIRKAGWLNSNGAVKHTAACEKSYISGVIRKSTEKPYFQKELRKYAKGIMEIRLRISVSDTLRRVVPLPKLEEQACQVSC